MWAWGGVSFEFSPPLGSTKCSFLLHLLFLKNIISPKQWNLIFDMINHFKTQYHFKKNLFLLQNWSLIFTAFLFRCFIHNFNSAHKGHSWSFVSCFISLLLPDYLLSREACKILCIPGQDISFLDRKLSRSSLMNYHFFLCLLTKIAILSSLLFIWIYLLSAALFTLYVSFKWQFRWQQTVAGCKDSNPGRSIRCVTLASCLTSLCFSFFTVNWG